MLGMRPLVGENLTKKGGCLGMEKMFYLKDIEDQSRCVLVVIPYGTDKLVGQVWDSRMCRGVCL